MFLDRIIDVNLNRLDESLKFLEDIIRFSLENKKLLGEIRRIRNNFLAVKKSLPLATIVISRKSYYDLGRSAKFDSQLKKTPRAIIFANLTRAKEASRIIEEILRVQKIEISNSVKEIRFKIYDLEKNISDLLRKKFNPRLYAILDEKYLRLAPIEKTIRLLENHGATMIQLRVKRMADKEFLSYATKIKKMIHKPDIKFIINNRIDIVLACGADGVHLGQDDMPVEIARTILGDSYIIGVSVCNIKDAKRAQKYGADYLGVGAIFKTKTKTDSKVCSLSTLKAIGREVTIPVVGIGGIDYKNYKKVLRVGASGIAVCSYLFEGDLRNNIRSLTVDKT